jgi:hypothetical protein
VRCWLTDLRRFIILVYCGALLAALQTRAAGRIEPLPAPEQAAIDRISADDLRGNLSFLSSDALEGRGTPSRGLDIAAEFIASQFRRAGLEPVASGDSYFQTAKFVEVTPRLDDFHLTLAGGGDELDLTGADVRVRSPRALDVKEAPVVTLSSVKNLPPIAGRIVAGEARRWGTEAALMSLQALRPAAIILVSKHDVQLQSHSFLEEADSSRAPVLRIMNEDAAAMLAENLTMFVSVHLSAPALKDVLLRNVAGILRGSDPVLRNQYLIVTAHYDHLGTLAAGNGDRIYNGANDNGSGTVSVMEMAGALATLHTHPKRSILFMTVFGEEEGLLGAYYYTHHPLVPLKDTIANINLEQMGRTDDKDGAEVSAFAFTGPSYSDLASTMGAAAGAEGVKVYHRGNEDDFFDRSDNYAFALTGIVAHTVVVAFDYPDYHGLADEWQKIDYANMAKVDRAVAAGLIELADSASVPQWSNAKQAAQYRDAAR